MREILKSAKDQCCGRIEIICPCTKEELAKIVQFLYFGEIQCEDVFESFHVQEDLNKIFGFPESLNLDDQIASLLDDPSLSSIIDLTDLELNEEIIENMVDEMNTCGNTMDLNNNPTEKKGTNDDVTKSIELIELLALNDEGFENLTEKPKDQTAHEKNPNVFTMQMDRSLEKEQETDLNNNIDLENSENVGQISITNIVEIKPFKKDIFDSENVKLIESDGHFEEKNEIITVTNSQEGQVQNLSVANQRDVEGDSQRMRPIQD